jgi:hypothetical protein
MITNIPAPDELENIALRLHFSAWSDLLSVATDFDQVFEPNDDDLHMWVEEKEGYAEACQPELQSICAVIQQSNEMALKARICAVSPFLLLLNTENKLSTQPTDVDFFSLRTLDAVDLPSTANTFCPTPLSEKFIQEYNAIRALRNSVLHAGKTSKAFSADELLHTLVFLYRELWPTRKWLVDRVEHAAQTRLAFFHDGRWNSAQAVVLNELPDAYAMFTNSEFKALFGKPRTARRYICHECSYQGTTKGGGHPHCPTAWLDDETHLTCRMCSETFKVARSPCKEDDCKGNVIGDNEDDYVGMCHTCGEGQ